MNNIQLLNRCKHLFESLTSLNEDCRKCTNNFSYQNVVELKTYQTEYKEVYKKFHESVNEIINQNSDLLYNDQIEFNDEIKEFKYWGHKWHFIFNVINDEIQRLTLPNNLHIDAVFQNIKENIIGLLKNANEEIVIAMAWFTDPEIISSLYKMPKEIHIQVITSDAEENFNGNSNLHLLKTKCDTFGIIPTTAEGGMMHHKFCVIDKKHVITGSYNWSYTASLNLENILIIRNNEDIAKEYIQKFNRMKALSELAQKKDFVHA